MLAKRVHRSACGTVEIEAEIRTAGVTARLVHCHFNRSIDRVLRLDGTFRMDLCLTSRHPSARACFKNYWSTDRFERIGDLFLLPPGFDLIARSDDDSPSSISIEIDAGYIYELLDPWPTLVDRYLAAALDIRVPKMRTLLVRAAEEIRQPGFASAQLIELLARQLAIELVRHGSTLEESPQHGALVPWQLRLIDERLREVREAPALSDLAALCRISVRQLARGFRASKGCSIGAYVANRQMEHAKQLLASEQNVTSIADALGFSSASNFCVAFRRATGLTPGNFRKSLLRH